MTLNKELGVFCEINFRAMDEQTRLDLAEENYSISAQALSLAPLSKLTALSFAGSVHQLAELGLSAKRMEAIESYERAVALQPGSWKVHNLLAESYMKGGLSQKALAAADDSSIPPDTCKSVDCAPSVKTNELD